MIRLRHAIALGLVITLALAAVPAGASHNNRGTVKVHDNETENPETRNVPHVSCDFFVEGFMMGDDSGWLEFFAWPPTGDMTEVTPTGDNLTWTADSGQASGEFHFLKGPYFLDAGHYRVEVFTDDGHPGADGGHFAKSKTFWVEPCEEEFERPPCPPDVNAVATSEAGQPRITLSWGAVADADTYVVYRAVSGGDFEMVHTTTETQFVDTNVTMDITYEYYVTAVDDGIESENCEVVEATAIPFFPGLLLGGVALVGSVAAFALLRRRV